MTSRFPVVGVYTLTHTHRHTHKTATETATEMPHPAHAPPKAKTPPPGKPPRNTDTPPRNTAETIENQIPKAINHTKHTSQKKPRTPKIYNHPQNNQTPNPDHQSVEAKSNELETNGIIDDIHKITNPIQKAMNPVTEDEVTICPENPEDEPNNPHRTVTPTKTIRPQITTQTANKSTTEDPKESDINVIKGQLQNLETKLVGKY